MPDILRAVGMNVEIRKPVIDESEFKRSLRADGASAAEVAVFLAELKANTISRTVPEALVIGADQMLEIEGSWLINQKIEAVQSRIFAVFPANGTV